MIARRLSRGNGKRFGQVTRQVPRPLVFSLLVSLAGFVVAGVAVGRRS